MTYSQRILGCIVTCWVLNSAGCATSLQPLVSSEVRADIAEISGQWTVQDSLHGSIKTGSTLVIQRRGVGSHYVELDQAGEKSSWHADTVKLGDSVFVDLFPDFESDPDKPEGIQIIATHVFYMIQKTGQELKVYGFDHSKLDPLATEERVAVPSPRNQRLIFVAEPKRLQEFFEKHGAANLQKAPVLVFKKVAGT